MRYLKFYVLSACLLSLFICPACSSTPPGDLEDNQPKADNSSSIAIDGQSEGRDGLSDAISDSQDGDDTPTDSDAQSDNDAQSDGDALSDSEGDSQTDGNDGQTDGDAASDNDTVSDNGEEPTVCLNGYGKDCRPYDSVTDAAGEIYKTIVIDGLTWTAENSRYTDQDVTCYENDAISDFKEKYGCLYIHEDAEKVCPAGWHLPSKGEFNILTLNGVFRSAGGHAFFALIASSDAWSDYENMGADDFGFAALPAGTVNTAYVDTPYTAYYFLGEAAQFWSSTMFSDDEAYYMDISQMGAGTSWARLNYGYAVRCVKDYTCSAHSTWDPEQGCICDQGFAGHRCNICAGGYSGEDCHWTGDYVEDSRDGESYRSVTLGSQIWLAENMHYADLPHYSVKGQAQNDAVFGYLYTYDAATDACPDGFRLPSEDDFRLLFSYMQENPTTQSLFLDLISKDYSWVNYPHFGGDLGFAAQPAGYMYMQGDTPVYASSGFYAYFWLKTDEIDPAAVPYIYIGNKLVNFKTGKIDNARSVRCIKE